MTPADNTPVQADALVIVEKLRARDRFLQSVFDRCVEEGKKLDPLVLTPDAEALMRDTIERQAADLIERLAHQPTTDAEAGPLAVLRDVVPLSVSSLWDCEQERQIVRAMEAYAAHPPADKTRIAELEAALREVLPFVGSIPIGEFAGRNYAAKQKAATGLYERARAALENRPTNQGGEHGQG